MRFIGIEDSVVHFQKHLLVRKCEGVTSPLFELCKKLVFALSHTIGFSVSEKSIQFLLSLFASAINTRCLGKPMHGLFDARSGCDLLDCIP